MGNIPFVCLYMSYLQSFSPFTDAEIGVLVKAMLSYAATGEIPVLNGNERYIWPSIQQQIDRDVEAYRAKCAKNRENGLMGGRPPKNPSVIAETERFLEKPKKAKENTKVKDKKKNNESIEADKPPTRHRFSPPTVEEVEEYCFSEGYKIDADSFVNYYESNGWMVGRNKMKNWHAACKNWVAREKTQKGKQTKESALDQLNRIFEEDFG